MNSKLLKSIGIAVLCLAIMVGVVYAFSLGTTDGVWGSIDSIAYDGQTDDASCSAWGNATNSPYTISDVLGVIYNVNVGPGGENERYVRNTDVCSGDIDGDLAFATNNPAGWTRTTSVVWTGFGSYTGCTSASGLFISEYMFHQRSNNPEEMAIEIYNGTTAGVDLSDYKLLLFSSDRDFDQVQLNSVTLGVGETYVLANNAIAGSVDEDQTFANNDYYRTVVLIKTYDPQEIQNSHTTDEDLYQDVYTTDENQVRYGRPDGYDDCPGNNSVGFATQSGFGFEGIELPQTGITEGDYFPIGRFCHYNNPISVYYDGNNLMQTVPLDMTISNIACDEGWTREDSGDLLFTYLVNLDETPNEPNDGWPDYDPIECKYGVGDPQWPGGSSDWGISGDIGPNRNGCADAVDFEASSSEQSFTCVDDLDDTHTQEYTVSILGFTQTQAGGVCPSEPVGTVQFNQIYTAESSKNCYCVYAAFTKGQITPVTLKSLGANGVEEGILISWETVTETNNLGFNILRADAVDGEKVQVNLELIISSGSTFGSAYDYLDETALEGVTYYYWLQDIPLDDSDLPSIHGPISAVR